MNHKQKTIVEEDFLEVDNSIRGQNYVCLSFISPEKVLKRKDSFILKHFLENTFNELKDTLNKLNVDLPTIFTDNIEKKFEDFIYNHGERLEKEFNSQNNFQTSIRGVKVRGVYDTYNELIKILVYL